MPVRGFSSNSKQAQAHSQVHNINPKKHDASSAHKLVARAAAFAAMKSFQAHVADKGRPAEHTTALKIAASFAGEFIQKIVETKNLESIDGFESAHAKEQAEEQIHEQLKQEYSEEGGDGANGPGVDDDNVHAGGDNGVQPGEGGPDPGEGGPDPGESGGNGNSPRQRSPTPD